MTSQRNWEKWLQQPEFDDKNEEKKDETQVKRRFHSLYLDLLHDLHERQQQAGKSEANSWRKAAYAVWLTMPRPMRVPRFANELAQLMGLVNDDAFRKWRKADPEFFDRAKESCKQMLNEWLPDVMYAAIQSATTEGAQGFQDRKMLLEIGEVYKPRQVQQLEGGEKPVRVVDDSLTDEERAERIAAILDRARARRTGQPTED